VNGRILERTSQVIPQLGAVDSGAKTPEKTLLNNMAWICLPSDDKTCFGSGVREAKSHMVDGTDKDARIFFS
jgi:hypothetical protein